MATDISPELLKRIQDFYAHNGTGVAFQDPATGTYYQPSGDGSSGSDFTRYNSYGSGWADGGTHAGETGQVYTPQGTYTGDYAWAGDNWKQNLLIALAAAGGMAFLPGAAAAGAGGAGAGAGDALATGGFLGEAPWTATGGGALDFGAAGAGAAGAGGGSLVGSSAGMSAPAASTAAFNSATAGGSGLTGLLGGRGMGDLTSLIGPIVGGLLGSQGQSTQQNAVKDLPDWLKPFVLGANGQGGVLNDAQALYRQQQANGGLNPLQQAGIEAQRQFLTSPQYTAGYDQMRGQGMDLMGRPVAGNPFTSGNTGGMGGYGSLSAPGAGGQAAHPSPNTSPFGYNPTPSLMAALNPLSAPQAAPQPQAPTSQDQIARIVADLMRQQNGASAPSY